MYGNVMNAVLCAIVAVTIPGLAAQPFVLSDPMNADEWRIELVDPGQTKVAAYNSIALDSNGFPHISYADNSGSNIKYARWDGSEWTLEFVDNSSDGMNSIDVDSKDNPHIVQTTDNLRYAWWNGTEWNVSTLDNSAVLGSAGIVLDDLDNPHIAYIHDQQQLRYLYWDGGKWISEGVTSKISNKAASIALDANGHPHLAFHQSDTLHYATRYGGNWFFENPDPIAHVGAGDPSIAIDSNGFPHISYYDGIDRNLLYARWNAGNWLAETVDTESAGKVSSLALSKDDYPRISYEGAGHLKFAEWTGSDWKIEVVDRMHIGTALALDDRGNPHVSYQRSHSLYYATKEMATQPPELRLDIDPDTLNLKSEGRWITAYLRGGNAEDIDASSLLLNDMISPEWWDLQNDTTLMAKFSRSFVQMISPVADEVDIKVTGQWKDGQNFELHDTIRVIDPGSYLEAPDPKSVRDMSPEYSRKKWSVIAPIGESTEGLRVGFRT